MDSQITMSKKRFLELISGKKMTPQEFSGCITMSDDRVFFESLDQLRKAANTLRLPAASLIETENDLDCGVKVCRGKEGYQRTEARNGDIYYTYTHLANSLMAPKLMSLHLTLHCSDPDKVVLNAGHDSQEFVYVLKGNVRMYWRDGGRERSELLMQGDSIYVHPNVPHSFIASGQSAEILAVNF